MSATSAPLTTDKTDLKNRTQATRKHRLLKQAHTYTCKHTQMYKYTYMRAHITDILELSLWWLLSSIPLCSVPSAPPHSSPHPLFLAHPPQLLKPLLHLSTFSPSLPCHFSLLSPLLPSSLLSCPPLFFTASPLAVLTPGLGATGGCLSP